jgi:hypothetical protein
MDDQQETERRRQFDVSQADFDDYNGICLVCGEVRYGGVEPDARGYPCDMCETNTVVGLQEALLMGRVSVSIDGFA